MLIFCAGTCHITKWSLQAAFISCGHAVVLTMCIGSQFLTKRSPKAAFVHICKWCSRNLAHLHYVCLHSQTAFLQPYSFALWCLCVFTNSVPETSTICLSRLLKFSRHKMMGSIIGKKFPLDISASFLLKLWLDIWYVWLSWYVLKIFMTFCALDVRWYYLLYGKSSYWLWNIFSPLLVQGWASLFFRIWL